MEPTVVIENEKSEKLIVELSPQGTLNIAVSVGGVIMKAIKLSEEETTLVQNILAAARAKEEKKSLTDKKNNFFL
jgi:hypothetical protein